MEEMSGFPQTSIFWRQNDPTGPAVALGALSSCFRAQRGET